MPVRRGIICGGCWTLDRIKIIDAWPAEESLAFIEQSDRQGGGSAYNLGIDICKLDNSLPVEAIGLIGNDDDGNFLHNEADLHGINVTQLRRTQRAATSYTDVMSDRTTGKRTFFNSRGANDLLTARDFNFDQSNAKILHLGLLGVHAALDCLSGDDANGWVSVLKKAQREGIKTNIDLVSISAGRIREICLPCLDYLDSLIVNDYEIGALASQPTIIDGQTDIGKCQQAAESVLANGNMQLVVVHYPAGAFCITRDGQRLQQKSVAVEPKNIVGSVGAGDAFAAGMLYALHENWPLQNALQLAHATAAASLRSATTVEAVETVEKNLTMAGYSPPLLPK